MLAFYKAAPLGGGGADMPIGRSNSGKRRGKRGKWAALHWLAWEFEMELARLTPAVEAPEKEMEGLREGVMEVKI